MTFREGLRKRLSGAEKLDAQIVETIYDKRWLRIWIPKEYNGLGYSFEKGLNVLREVAEIDGSLGWLVTLCSGANFFSRNIIPEVAKDIFENEKVCFGGGGMIGGTAEKRGDMYFINGLWNYATGAPYLSHFTLNAQIVENGKPLFDENGEPEFLSFVLDPEQVELIPTWKSMGMVATASHSFKVSEQYVPEQRSFVYNRFYSDDYISRIPFETFADLTLLVNYLGMAQHYLDESLAIKKVALQQEMEAYLIEAVEKVNHYAKKTEQILLDNGSLEAEFIMEVHAFGEKVVEELIVMIIKLHQLMGVKASVTNHGINQVFRDFFTATQHFNFRKEK
ncbi:acyl-CoA dehydrogenase family protein [Flavobacterium hauense]